LNLRGFFPDRRELFSRKRIFLGIEEENDDLSIYIYDIFIFYILLRVLSQFVVVITSKDYFDRYVS